MKKIILVFICIFAQISLASPAGSAPQKTFDLEADLTLNGKHIGSPRIILVEGDISTVVIDSKEGKVFLSVTTAALEKSEKYKNAVHLKFAIGKVTADGRETIISKLAIISNIGQETTITQGNGKNKEIELKVLATLQPEPKKK